MGTVEAKHEQLKMEGLGEIDARSSQGNEEKAHRHRERRVDERDEMRDETGEMRDSK